MKVQKWLRFPDIVARICDKALGWAFYSNEPKVSCLIGKEGNLLACVMLTLIFQLQQQQMGATLDIQRQEQAELWEQQYMYNRAQDFRQNRGQGYYDRIVDDTPPAAGLMNYLFRGGRGQQNGSMEPTPDNIQILVDMGFDRTQAIEALRTASNDLETATSILLRH